MFDYKSKMKEYYKSDKIANEYHKAFSDSGYWHHRVIAKRERRTVQALLRRVPHGTVLDIPTGTGKLAPVLAELGSSVLACDISESMLEIAKEEYNRVGARKINFKVCDAEKASRKVKGEFDVAVCLRLLHRVPYHIKKKILDELRSISEFVIVSTAVESRFHKLRRSIREKVLGGDSREHCYETPTVTQEIVTDGFKVIASKRVLPILSQERVYLLQSIDE